jgi:hypothetical protein
MLGMDQTVEEAGEVKTPLVAQTAAMVACKPFGPTQEQAFNMVPLGVAAALRHLLQQTLVTPARLVTVEAPAFTFLIRVFRMQGNHY